MRTLEITTKIGCINQCFYCPQDKLEKAYVGEIYLTYNNYIKALSTVPKDIRIDFSGMCEPFLNAHAVPMILETHRRGYKIAVFSTCINLSNKHIDVLKQIPFETFEIHLQDRQGYAHIPQSKELKSIIKRIQMEFHNVITGDLSKIRIISRAGNLSFVYNQYKEGPLFCERGLERFVLLPNGNLYLCCMDYSLQHYIGNLFENSYLDIINSKQFNQVKVLMNSSEGKIICRKCEFANDKN